MAAPVQVLWSSGPPFTISVQLSWVAVAVIRNSIMHVYGVPMWAVSTLTVWIQDSGQVVARHLRNTAI